MYLKSIEVQGFKSFANKIIFEFHNGITGIVGPNGSGKSNVADAVRWVLGEQKVKQLRSSSMQDVIFSGTEMRKPQGFAYVAITLDNSDHQLAIDYGEVTVSRRIYRSGESEYLLNGSACRLKDINELFYDTGIGKEGYSIIGQGQIDKILSGRPEDRRELFDEATGIVKFKKRKKTAEKKLEDEKQNLIRVTDILSELEKQVGPLERQSKTAREYLQLKEELKVCDANQFLLDTENTHSQLKEVENRRRLLAGDVEETQKKADDLRKEYDTLEEKLTALDEVLIKNRAALSEAAMEKSSREGQINVLREQIHTEEANEEHYKSRKNVISQDLENYGKQLASYVKEREDAQIQVKDAGERLEAAKTQLQEKDDQIYQLENEIEQAKSEIIQALNDKADLTARQQHYETMLEQVNLRRSEVSQKLLRFKSDESVQDEKILQEKAALDQVQEQLEKAQFSAEEAEEGMNAALKEVQRLNKNLNNTQQEYHMAHTKLESLRNLAERYDGYGNSIRRVMEVRDRIHGIRGVVADIISTEKKYETAIETALGGSIQNIVTDSEETAKRLIEHLKKNKYGRATFLPLTSVGKNQSPFPKPEALKEPGVLGLASSLVQADKEYEGLIRYLLGRVVVADTIDHAIAIARKYHYSLRIVFLEGELLNAGGSMTGGAFKNTSNLLGRRREIEELETACNGYLKQTDSIQQELSLQEATAAEKKEISEQLRNEIQKLALSENTIRINISTLEDKKNEIADSSADLVREHALLEEQVREITEGRASLKAEEGRLEERNTNSQKQIDEKSLLLNQEKLLRENCSLELSKIQLESSALEQQLSFTSENENRVIGEIRKLKDEDASLEAGKNDSRKAIEEKEAAIIAIQKEIESSKEDDHQLEEEIQKTALEKEEVSKQQKNLFQTREDISKRLSDLDKDLFRVQSQAEKLEEHLESLAAYMWSEYEMTLNQAKELKKEELSSLPEIRRQIDALKEQIKSLGNINVNAIEDYREVSERYEFMRAQHEDLVNAQAELEKIIEELDIGMRRQFEEKFREIRAEFDKVFKELFGGGRGTLELMEGEDLLEAGIQIIAQPPGKKLQNMMQLSGGEKALTAISLLFAIQNLKPSPFCLLDEIEAALDDSNVDRFANYLHKLTKNTQFIVITHRRGTMMAADRLYGITMQEKGVSTLVSVNLIEDSLTK